MSSAGGPLIITWMLNLKKNDKISLKIFGRLSELLSSREPSAATLRTWKQLVLSITALIGSAPHFLNVRRTKVSSFLVPGKTVSVLKSMAMNSLGLWPVWFRISFHTSHPSEYSGGVDGDCEGVSTNGTLTQICGGALTTFTFESSCKHRETFGSRWMGPTPLCIGKCMINVCSPDSAFSD